MLYRILLSAILSIFCISTFAQEVDLKQDGKNSFSFSTKDMVLIKDLDIDGPSYHFSSSPYEFTLKALTASGAHDQSVNGKFKLEVNGRVREVEFMNGSSALHATLEKENLLHVKVAGTNVEKSKRITRVSSTPGFLGVVVFLLLTFLFRHKLAGWFRGVVGSDKK